MYLKIKSLTEDIGRYIPRNELTRNINFDKNLMGITLYYWIAKDIKIIEILLRLLILVSMMLLTVYLF
nr:MAG TPA: hypothetical protein [Caudoviricetes sp.]